jgi:hypothetical protein
MHHLATAPLNKIYYKEPSYNELGIVIKNNL